MKDAITTTSMTRTLHRTDERLVAEQLGPPPLGNLRILRGLPTFKIPLKPPVS
jgi:hypothetical protein